MSLPPIPRTTGRTSSLKHPRNVRAGCDRRLYPNGRVLRLRRLDRRRRQPHRLTEGGQTTLGIDELDGDNLKICFPGGRKGERSTSLESKPNSVNEILIILKRDEP